MPELQEGKRERNFKLIFLARLMEQGFESDKTILKLHVVNGHNVCYSYDVCHVASSQGQGCC